MRRKRQKKPVLRYFCAVVLTVLTACLPAVKKAGGIRETYALMLENIHGVSQTVPESVAVLPAMIQNETIAESAQIYRYTETVQSGTSQPAADTVQAVIVASGYAPEIVNHTKYKIDPSSLYGSYIPDISPSDEPQILIVHTHSSESYTADPDNPYLPDDVMRTLDTKYNVVRIGDEIASLLEEAGIKTLHDREINDYPSYNGSYSQMLKKVNRILSENPSVKMVLDVHRDAILDDSGNNIAMKTQINGDDCARLMFVVGTDAGGLSHPDWRKNLGFAATMQGFGDTLYPGLMRSVDLRSERFNQHTTAASLILEVGSAGNTLTEALKSAHYFTEIFIASLGLQ